MREANIVCTKTDCSICWIEGALLHLQYRDLTESVAASRSLFGTRFL